MPGSNRQGYRRGFIKLGDKSNQDFIEWRGPSTEQALGHLRNLLQQQPPAQVPVGCQRCQRNEPDRFCTWCERHVCTEQCWVNDECKRCCDCRDKDESEEKPNRHKFEETEEFAQMMEVRDRAGALPTTRTTDSARARVGARALESPPAMLGH